MPRTSARKKAIAAARRVFRAATAMHIVSCFIKDYPELFDIEDPDPVTVSFMATFTRLLHLRESRYVIERKCRKSVSETFEDGLRVNEDGSHWLNDSEFKKKYRCTRATLDKITAAIENNPVFAEGSRGSKQIPVKHQLMILLQFLGQESENNESQRQKFKTGYGSNCEYRKRVVQALIDIRKEWIYWPDAEERKEIAQRIETLFHFPNCIGMMDGTLLPLAFEPSSDDAADYHGRKFPYSLTVLVINDDKRRIRAYLSGYPGSTHDNRLWRNMKPNHQADKYFSPQEYVLADTAFEPSDNCIPAYKNDAAFHLDPDKVKFNTALSSPRVITEHTMGLWKGRLPWLRSIRMRITNDKKTLRNIIRYIDATVVLHNMLIEFGDGDDPDAPWGLEDEVLSDIGDETRAPERTLLDLPTPQGSAPGTRRDQLKNYIREMWFRWRQNGGRMEDYDVISKGSEMSSDY